LKFVTSPLSFFAIERQEKMPTILNEWLQEHGTDPLAPVWVVVPSAAIRQRLEWDLAYTRTGDYSISSNMRYFFPEEFVRTVEETVMADLGHSRYEWRPETIATRLVGLSTETISWRHALAEAAELDEVIRWRRDEFNPSTLPTLCQRLIATDEWEHHGPFVQRDEVIDGLTAGHGRLAPVIVLYGLENAPGGSEFVKLIQAISQRAFIGVFTAYPSATRASTQKCDVGASWWCGLDEHLDVWRASGVEITPRPGEVRPGTLGRLQATLAGEEVAESSNLSATVRVIGSVGPARQAEMARDEILRLLEDETKKVEPNRILVTSPNLARFVPHLERHWAYAPFAEDENGQRIRLPRLVFELTEKDGSSLRTRGVLAARLLDLVNNYVTLAQVEELLQFSALTAAIDLDDESVLRVSTVAREARVSFGISTTQRASFGLSADGSPIGTWQRFFDRLALTAMMPDVDDPEQLGASTDLTMVAGLNKIFRCVERAQSSLSSASTKTIDQWLEWFSEHFGDLMERAGSRDDSLEKALRQITEDFEWANGELAIPFSFFRDYWNSLASSGSRAQNFGGFGVHVAPLSALTSAAYDYVVILGLDEENFPNASVSSPTFQPPRAGDPNPRNALLASLLLAINSATKELIVTFNSRNELSGEPVKAPVVLEELREFLGKATPILEGPRHGFVRPTDLERLHDSFDPKYRGLGTAIAQSDGRESRTRAAIKKMASAVEKGHATEVLSVKGLQFFLRNPSAHFVSRGLLGEPLSRIDSSAEPPRIQYNGLERFIIREEIIDRLVTSFFHSGNMDNADDIYSEIVQRESVAADIPFQLVTNLISGTDLVKIATNCFNDLSDFEPLTPAEELAFYAPIDLPCGVTLRPRNGQPDEARPWTVLRDFSRRQLDSGGGPATIRFYPNKWDPIKERRSALAMWIDLLIMKVNESVDRNLVPTTYEFFPGVTAKGSNAMVSYRYIGSRDEALVDLDALVRLFEMGSTIPLAIGRHSTPMEIETGSGYEGFVEDRKESSFNIIFEDDYQEFLQIGADQEVSPIIEGIAKKIEKAREPASERLIGRVGTDDSRSTFKLLSTWRKEAIQKKKAGS